MNRFILTAPVIVALLVACIAAAEPELLERTQPDGYTIATIDLSHQKHRQVIVERTPGQYLGHPTTVLLEDGKTIYVTYPLGHGGPAAVLKKSTDGGLTWSERLPVPATAPMPARRSAAAVFIAASAVAPPRWAT